MAPNYFVTARHRNLAHAALLLSGMAGLLALLGWTLAGSTGVIWALVFGAGVTFLSPRITPSLLLRLYGARALAPQQAPAIAMGVRELAHRANLPQPPALYLIPSQVPNAFAVGSRESAALAISHGLAQTLSTREVLAVLGHEIAHIKSNDMGIMGLADVISRITSTFSLFGQIIVLINLPLLITGHVTLPWNAVFVLLGAPYLSVLLQLALSRSREFDADLEGARLSGDPEGLASALGRIELHQTGLLRRIFLPNGRNPHPSPLRSHPETAQRIERLRKLAHQPRDFQPLYTLIQSAPLTMRSAPHRPRWRMGGLWY